MRVNFGERSGEQFFWLLQGLITTVSYKTIETQIYCFC